MDVLWSLSVHASHSLFLSICLLSLYGGEACAILRPAALRKRYHLAGIARFRSERRRGPNGLLVYGGLDRSRPGGEARRGL